jgi:chromosome segregation ATPase
MEHNTELVRLEQFVDSLLTGYKSLKERYDALEAKLENRNSECARLKETVAELRGERTEVGSRITGLIERIEKWEAEQEQYRQSAADEDSEEGVQGSLFNQENTAAQ